MLRNILYSFPVRLLVNHVKENKILLFFWFVLFGSVTGNLGGFLGLRHLLLAPEYLGNSDVWGFFIMGIVLGGFTMAFHITTCIIDMHRFPFVGTLSRPFPKLCLNNSIIPLAFLIYRALPTARTTECSGDYHGQGARATRRLHFDITFASFLHGCHRQRYF